MLRKGMRKTEKEKFRNHVSVLSATFKPERIGVHSSKFIQTLEISTSLALKVRINPYAKNINNKFVKYICRTFLCFKDL